MLVSAENLRRCFDLNFEGTETVGADAAPDCFVVLHFETLVNEFRVFPAVNQIFGMDYSEL